jgi:hypothetical protein
MNRNSKENDMKLRLTMIVMALLAAVALSKPAFANEQVCHKTGNGTFHLISIAPAALSAHIDHGDGRTGDPVPDKSGFIFGPNCTPTVAPPPALTIGCYTIATIPSSDLSYFGPIDILGNIALFPDSNNGTCSGTKTQELTAGIIAAGNATDAQTKCVEITARATSQIIDLGAPGVLMPSAPGFWLCVTGPAE